MQFDFPTILFLAALFTGLVWAIDIYFWAPKRKQGLSEGEKTNEPILVEYCRSFFPVILIVLLLRSFLMEPFRIPSGSMMPTLLVGDFILVNKYEYGIRLPVINKKIIDIGNPERGDVVVFRFPKDPSTDYIKRVIGVPGDRIEYKNKMLHINGIALKYIDKGVYTGWGSGISMSGAQLKNEKIGSTEHDILVEPRGFNYAYPCMQQGQFVVPEGQYFVMGDNRDNSNDSRFWCTVPDENLVGKAFMVWMNWDSAGDGVGWNRIGNSIE